MDDVRAILLCAGSGVRVAEITKGKPKSYLKVGDETLIERQLRLLRGAGVQNITLVVGFEAKVFRDSFPECNFVENPDYRSTNTAYSLALALRATEERTVLVLNADVYYEDGVMEGIMELPAPTAAALDRKRNGEEEIKVLLSGNQLSNIGKYVSEDKSAGEAFGIYKISPQFARYLRRELLLQNNPKAFYERGIDQLLKGGHHMAFYDIGDGFCMEIDTPDDYYELLSTLGIDP